MLINSPTGTQTLSDLGVRGRIPRFLCHLVVWVGLPLDPGEAGLPSFARLG